ncbi:MAG TPA: hypothetical protein VIK52_05780 [Opitutaceae bacterium]
MDAPLDKASRNLLRVVYSRGIVRGRDAKRFGQFSTSKEFMEALQKLSLAKLVTLETGLTGVESEEAAMESYISPLPSRKAEAEYELGRQD